MKRTFLFHLSLWWQYAIALFFSLFFGFPLLWMIISSFKSSRELIRNMWALPTHMTLNGYRSVLVIEEFILFYINSIVITVVSVTLLTIVATMAAFVFARISFPGRNVLLYTFVAGMMIPLHVTLIPLYIMLRSMGMLNKLMSLPLPYVAFGLPMSIYILRTFFEQISVELEEAARLDGASTAHIFWSIMLPLSKPAVVTVTILNVISVWNEYLLALTFVSGNNRAYTLPLGVYSIVASVATFQYDKAMSALTLTALPILVLFFIMQRQIIKGLITRALQ